MLDANNYTTFSLLYKCDAYAILLKSQLLDKIQRANNKQFISVSKLATRTIC
jgi:hypothetical protein